MNTRPASTTIRRRSTAWVALLALAGALPAQPTSQIDISQGCVTADCHGEVKEASFLHGPVNLNECEPCHVPIGNTHVFRQDISSRETCLVCHESEAAKAVVHEPFAAECISCHDPHQADNRFFVKGGTGAEGCNACHSDVRAGVTHLHGPVALGECLACHTPHQSDHAGLLVEARTDLCLGCHVDVAQTMANAVSVHEPVGQVCAGCHEPHGGVREFFHPVEQQDLCRECHGDFLAQVAGFTFNHQAMTEGESCANCHAPHASAQAGLLNEQVGNMCLGCHDREIETEHGTLYNVKAQLEGAQFLHGPLRENNCSACHEAHGSDAASILNKPFPESFYTAFAPEKYDLCFECHDKQIIEDERSTTTEFRNGNANLHFLHVNREKGRSCRACHHEHASNQPNHVREEVPFGRWSMKVEFAPTATGGGCTTGCHLPYKYDRETPVDNTTEVSL